MNEVEKIWYSHYRENLKETMEQINQKQYTMATAKKITQVLFEQTAAKYQKAQDTATEYVKKRNAELEPLQKQIAAVQKKYDSKIEAERLVIEESSTIMQAYCEQNKKVLFGEDVRSMDMGGFTLGFRLGKPKVIMPEEKSALKGILDKIKKLLPGYLRTKEEIDKSKLIADRELPEVIKALPKIGISIGQEDAFFIEPK